MAKYSKILAAFDGSDSGVNALKQAITISKQTPGASLKALAVMPSYEGELELAGIIDIEELIKGPTERLAAMANDVAKSAGMELITCVDQGVADERITVTAEADKCDLIVMGRRGLTRLERMLMGSVTTRVIGHTKIDVLVVPRDAKIGFKRILLAVDGSHVSDAAASKAVDLAKSYGGSVTAVNVIDINEEFYSEAPGLFDKLEDKAKTYMQSLKPKAQGIGFDTIIKEGDAYVEINATAKDIKADLIVMGSHGHRAIRRFFLGSVTEKVIGHAEAPVLVVKR